jgi:hypothetical protein
MIARPDELLWGGAIGGSIRHLRGGTVAKKTNVLGVRARRGEKMKQGRAWRLVSPGERVFKAILVKRLKIGAESVAIFKVLPVQD